MKARRFYCFCASLILILPLTFGTNIAVASSVCDPSFVTQVGKEIIVSPTGIDDTANLQCAFDEAGPGAMVRLLPGTFYTKQIVVHDFHGFFTGAGDSRTTIVNLPAMYVTPIGFDQNPPSAANPWPVLIAIMGGDISISDLAIHITGARPTTPWQQSEEEWMRERLLSAIWIQGTGSTKVEIREILISGEEVDHPDYNLNLAVGTVAFGDLDENFASFHVLDSSFTTTLIPIDMITFTNTDVVISHNRFYNGYSGTWVERFTNCSFEFSHNTLVTYIGLFIATDIVWEDTGNSYLIKTNKFLGGWGIAIDTIFGEGNQCLLLGNNVQNTQDVGIALGEGVHGCTIVGGSNKTNVWDLGYDNILVGVNNMGTGVGPSIHDLLKELR